MEERLKKTIRSIPDFPKEGILFRDITTLLKDKSALADAIDLHVARHKGKGIDKIVFQAMRKCFS